MDLNYNIVNLFPNSVHNLEITGFDECKDELLFDPNNYFYINGHKFIKLDLIKKMKENRGEPKDIKDIRLINNFINLSLENTTCG